MSLIPQGLCSQPQPQPRGEGTELDFHINPVTLRFQSRADVVTGGSVFGLFVEEQVLFGESESVGHCRV